MKKEVMEQWVAALRSGEYAQVDGVLRARDESGDSFCCLGVLCQISGLEEPEDEHTGYSRTMDEFLSNPGDEVLPGFVQEWSGMRSEQGDLDGDRVSLANLNDKGHTFLELADIIEEEWENL